MKLLSILHQFTKYKHTFRKIFYDNQSDLVYYCQLRSFSNTLSLNQWGKNKKHRNVQLKWHIDTMADEKIELVLAPLRANVKEQVSNHKISDRSLLYYE